MACLEWYKRNFLLISDKLLSQSLQNQWLVSYKSGNAFKLRETPEDLYY
jgi:hypothetical protein